MAKNVIIGQSGGPTAVINSSLAGVYKAACSLGADKVYGMKYGIEGLLKEEMLELNVLLDDRMSIELLKRTPSSCQGSCRYKLPDPDVDSTPFIKLFTLFDKYDICAVFYIGGNDSMDTIAKLSRYGERVGSSVRFIGVPKTIDNDINFVPQSFGFDTAVDKATEAIGCAHVEAVGTPNGIGIVKLMGRESGFIAAQSALALREANFVLIPEAPFQLHGDGGLLPALERRLKLRGHAVIIAAEGAGQHLLQQNEARDASGNPVLSDVGSLLRTSIVDYFHGKMPISIKYIDPSYIIRSVPANANDRVYCGFLGQHAVHAAMAGRTEMVVAKIMDRYVHIPLDLVTKKRRKLDIRSGLWRAVLESTGQGELTGMLPEGEKA